MARFGVENAEVSIWINCCKLPSAMVGFPNQMSQYLCDADGNRIGKGTITQWSCDTDSN